LAIDTGYFENIPTSSPPAISNSGSLLRAEMPGCRVEKRYRTGKLILQETQDLDGMEVVWFRIIGVAAVLANAATQETAIDLCGLDTQDRECIQVYTGK
jgi:hypothetical protein